MSADKRIRASFARSRVSVPPSVNERMMSQTLSAFAADPQGNAARNGGSPVLRIAAGITVLAAVAAVWSHLGLTLDGSRTALARITDALSQTPWVHVAVIDRTSGDNRSRDEMWFAPQRQIRILKSGDPNGPILWSDYLRRERRGYDARTGKLTLSYEPQRMPETRDPPWNYLGYVLGPDVPRDMRIAEGIETFGQRPMRTYDMTMEEAGIIAHLRLVADIDTHLPLLMTIEAVDDEGRQRASLEVRFDYPPTGPEDLYAVGVPRTAEVIDDRPTPEVEELARICREYRSVLRHYIFIVIGTHGQDVIDQIEVHYVEGDTAQAGREWKALTCGYAFWPPRNEPVDRTSFNNVDEILHWLETSDDVRLWTIELWDGRYHRRLQMNEGEDPVYRQSRNIGGRRDLHGFAWPCYLPSGRIAQDELSRRNGYICWETQGRTFHFDPAHDYCCVRLEQSGGTWIRDTLSFARTEAGLWYPRQVQLTMVQTTDDGQEPVREVTHTDVLFLEPVSGFPQGFFGASRLPRTAQATRDFPKVPNLSLR